MTVRIQLRRDSEANWIAANPVLFEGEAAVSLDKNEVKIGDGVKEWTALEYLGGDDKTPELMSLINKNASDIATETQQRQSGDAALSSQITIESAARAEADNELSGRIQSLENNPSVPDGLEEQVQANTEAIGGLVTNDENLAEAINGKMSLPQGELVELKDTDWLVIGRTDPNTSLTPTYLSRLSVLREEIGGGGTGPEPPETDPGFAKYKFAGEAWWGQPAVGELWTNFGENQIFLNTTDLDSKNQTENIKALEKGETLLVTATNGWARFSIKASPSFGSGENGDYFVINVRPEDLEGNINIGDEVVLSLSEDQSLATYIESVPSMDPMTELYEAVAKMKKEITSLKGQITRLKNGK